MGNYVHGYGSREAERLADQAAVLRPLLHHDTSFPPGTRVLEVGCGTGEQTETLLRRCPGIELVSLDRSPAQIAKAEARLRAAGLSGARFVVADLYDRPFPAGSFDHIFACFVLEHLPSPEAGLAVMHDLVRPGGGIIAVEGDHGSCYFHPDDPAARQVWSCLAECQRRLGGDAHIGRRLFPLLRDAGFAAVTVSPRLVYCDASRPDQVEGFVRRTIIPMVAGVRDMALAHGLVDAATWDAGMLGLARSAETGGTFCYTFFKAVGTRSD